MHIDGGQSQAYEVGWADALEAAASALGIADQLSDERVTIDGATRPATLPRAPKSALKKPDGKALGPTHQRVAELIAVGQSNPEIAAALKLKPNTIRRYRLDIRKTLSGDRMSAAKTNASTPKDQHMLTARELEVTILAAQGCDPETIGETLLLDQASVRRYLQGVKAKIGTNEQSGLAMWLREHPAPASEGATRYG